MNTTDLWYKELLQKKLDVLEAIHKNTIDQSHALKEKDDVLLGSLLKECEAHIKTFTQLMGLSEKNGGTDDSEAAGQKQAINALLRKIVFVNGINVKKIEELRIDIADKIRRLKMSRNFIQNSGLRTSRQGNFIDKRI